MLEDERQKVEDLMFRNEEENINKEDYNVCSASITFNPTKIWYFFFKFVNYINY